MIWNFIRPLSQQHSSSSDMTVPTNNQWCVPWSKCTSIYFVNQVAMNQLWFFILMQPNSNQNHNVPLQEDHKNRILVRKRLSGRSSSLPVMLTTSYVLFFSWEKKNKLSSSLKSSSGTFPTWLREPSSLPRRGVRTPCEDSRRHAATPGADCAVQNKLFSR